MADPPGGGTGDVPDPMHVPPEWAEAAALIAAGHLRRILVLGAVDVGKSTLCRFLVGETRRQGRSAALLDTDLGQKTVGPPACVTLQDSRGMRLAFVGTTNPVPGWKRLIDGTRRLARETDASLVVANTSGVLRGPGRRLKAAKIEAFRPDLLIALGGGPDLEAILSDHPGLPALRLARSPEARRKTDGQRRALRREAFRRYFATASVLSVTAQDLQLGVEDPPLHRLLVGLYDGHEHRQGLGLLLDCCGGEVMRILTPMRADDIAGLVPGSLCLDETFAEVCARMAGQTGQGSGQP